MACNRDARAAHRGGTQVALVGLVLCACGGAPAVAIENRGGPTSARCELPARLEVEARQHAGDGDADAKAWIAWRVGIQLRRDGETASVTMIDADVVITYDARLRHDGCTLALASSEPALLGPYAIEIDLADLSGWIRSETRTWVIGSPARP